MARKVTLRHKITRQIREIDCTDKNIYQIGAIYWNNNKTHHVNITLK